EDAERAQQAFEIVNRSWKTLENEETRKKCLDVAQEAKERTDHMSTGRGRRWRTKRQGISAWMLHRRLRSVQITWSWKTLENEETRKKCLDVAQEAKERRDHMLSRGRRWRTKRQGRSAWILHRRLRNVHITWSWKALENEETRNKCLDVAQEAKERTDHMLFADMERKRQHLETRDMEERKRK
ncbi:DnaJ-21, partial [Operophtera brumata]